jgi:tetratricopeptide (TPR) repeat protein
MIEQGRYTSGRIAVANLSASIEAFERGSSQDPAFGDLETLSKLLFLRGDVLGRIADHDRAEQVALAAVGIAPDEASAFFLRAHLAGRFHRFDEASALLDKALVAGYPIQALAAEKAALLQATGRYREALLLREQGAREKPGIDTLGALATLLAEMGDWEQAERQYTAALNADDQISPLPCAQLLFEWGVGAMRRGDLDRAEFLLAELDPIMPDHVPGRGHRAEVAFARGDLDLAQALIAPLLDVSDDPEYCATFAEILAKRGDWRASREADRAAAAYERLLARRPEAYADHAAAFFIGIGNRPPRALQLAELNFKLRDTPRSRRLLAKAQRKARELHLEEALI